MDKIVERDKIYLAALLHDIGKFYQRADTGKVSDSKYLNSHNKDEKTFCPVRDGRYSHKHVLWTAQFIEDNKSIFDVKNSNDLASIDDNLINLAAGHHLPNINSLNGRIIKKADCLSSGMDRDKNIALKDDQDESNWDSFKKKRMISILETVGFKFGNKDVENSNRSWYHLPIDSIRLDEKSFPKKEFTEDPDYKTLWECFTKELGRISNFSGYRVGAENMLSLLYKYTSCIPASTINFPDVSLYDHLKTTAAIAVCLYDVQKENENLKKPFIMIGADVSGIQSYIYNIVSKYAKNNLKGRSFYIRLLTDAIARYIIKSLNLYQSNVIYNSGGGFYILAPNTSEVKKKLDKAIALIEKNIFEKHGEQLFVAIDYVEFSEDVLFNSNGESLADVWRKVFEKRDLKKRAKYSRLIEDDYSKFFEPLKLNPKAKFDVISGEEIIGKGYPLDEDKIISNSTNEQIELGKQLRDAYVIIVSEDEKTYWKSEKKSPLCVNPIDIGIYYYFFTKNNYEAMVKNFRGSVDNVNIIALNGNTKDCNLIYDDANIRGSNNIYSLEFYGGNQTGSITLEDLYNRNESEESLDVEEKNGIFQRLGVLRMDVDNLGQIFRDGIESNRATLSRFSSLSRSLDYFFMGYVNTICREEAPNDVIIIYSGGDDLFIVGNWDKTIDVAEKIRTSFRQYSCENENLSISGGIALIKHKFPILKGAELSGREEILAKSHKCNSDNKNSLSFLATPLNWDNEFKYVKKLKNEICKLIEEKRIPKSFIFKVLSLLVNAKIKDHKVSNPKIYWMLAYDMSRLIARENLQKEKAFINKFIVEVSSNNDGAESIILNGEEINTNYHPLELWAFACRWAELDSRKRN